MAKGPPLHVEAEKYYHGQHIAGQLHDVLALFAVSQVAQRKFGQGQREGRLVLIQPVTVVVEVQGQDHKG